MISEPDSSNPTVYSTDHKVYFQEVESEGKLDRFLDWFATKEEFREVVTEYLEVKF